MATGSAGSHRVAFPPVRRRLLVLPLLALCGLVVAGCASEDGRQPRASYVTKVEAVCKDASGQLRKLAPPRTAATGERYVGRYAEIVRAEAERLAEIEPLPRGRVATARAFVAAHRAFADQLERNRAALASSFAPDRETTELLAGLQTGSLTLAQARRLERRFPSLAEVVTALQDAHATRLVDLGQTRGQTLARTVYDSTPAGRANAAIAGPGRRLQALNASLGTRTCLGAG